jgi:thiol:disulfide interchange protein DsbD
MKVTLKKNLILALTVAQLPLIAFAQSGPSVLSVSAPSGITAKPGHTASATLSVTVAPGYHANSNKPADSYLIPLTLTWNSGPFETAAVVFPKPLIQKLGFSATPVSVFTGSLNIVTQFKIAGDAAPGAVAVKGKLHYQACDDRSCLPPKTVEVSLPVEIVK